MAAPAPRGGGRFTYRSGKRHRRQEGSALPLSASSSLPAAAGGGGRPGEAAERGVRPGTDKRNRLHTALTDVETGAP